MRIRISTVLFAGLAAIGAMAGCSQQTRDQDGATANRDVHDEGQWMKEAAGKSESAAERFSHKAGEAADNDQTSMAVKSALISAKDMNTTRMRVDTNGKAVTLSGAVPTEDERQRASQVAKGVLGSGYTVKNQLTVGGF